jgi:hypothetical protein
MDFVNTSIIRLTLVTRTLYDDLRNDKICFRVFRRGFTWRMSNFTHFSSFVYSHLSYFKAAGMALVVITAVLWGCTSHSTPKLWFIARTSALLLLTFFVVEFIGLYANKKATRQMNSPGTGRQQSVLPKRDIGQVTLTQRCEVLVTSQYHGKSYGDRSIFHPTA